MKKKPRRHNESTDTHQSSEQSQSPEMAGTEPPARARRDKSRSASRHRRSLSSLFRRQSGDKRARRSESREQRSRDRSDLDDEVNQHMEVRLKPREHLSRLTVREALLESRTRGRSPHRNTVKLEKLILNNRSDTGNDIVDGPEWDAGDKSARYGTFPRQKKRRVASDPRGNADSIAPDVVLHGATAESQDIPLDKRKYIIDPVNRRDDIDTLESLGLFATIPNDNLLQPHSPTHSTHDSFPFQSSDPDQDRKRRDSFLHFLQLRDKKPSRSPQSSSIGNPSEPSTPIGDINLVFPGDNESRQSAFSVVAHSQSLIPQPDSTVAASPVSMGESHPATRPSDKEDIENVTGHRKSASKSPSGRGTYVSPRRFTRASRSSVTSSASNTTDIDIPQPETPSSATSGRHTPGRYHRQFSSSSEKRKKLEKTHKKKAEPTMHSENTSNITQHDLHPVLDSIIKSSEKQQGSYMQHDTADGQQKMPDASRKTLNSERQQSNDPNSAFNVEPALAGVADKAIFRPIPVNVKITDKVVKPLALKPIDIPNTQYGESEYQTQNRNTLDTPVVRKSDTSIKNESVIEPRISKSQATGNLEKSIIQNRPIDKTQAKIGYDIVQNIFEPIREPDTLPVTLAEVFNETEDSGKNVEAKPDISVIDTKDVPLKKEKSLKSKDSKSKKLKEKKKKEPKTKDKNKEKSKIKNEKEKVIEEVKGEADDNVAIVPESSRSESISKPENEPLPKGIFDRKKDKSKKEKSKKSKEKDKTKGRKQSKDEHKKKEEVRSEKAHQQDVPKESEHLIKSDDAITVLDNTSPPESESRTKSPLTRSEINKSKKKMKKEKKKESKLGKSASGSDIEVKMVRSSSLCDIKDADEMDLDRKRLQRSRSVVSKKKHQKIDEDLLMRRKSAQKHASAPSVSHAASKHDSNKVGSDKPQPKLSLTAIIAMKAGLARMRKAKELARAQQASQDHETHAKHQDTSETRDSSNNSRDDSEDARVAKVVFENEVNTSIGKQSDLNDTEIIDDEFNSADKEVKDLVYERKIHFPFNDESISNEDLIKQRQRNTRLTGRRESKVRQRQKRVINCLKQFVAFLFSHIGLCTLVVAYCILGGFIFRELEGAAEMKEKKEMEQLRQKFRDEIYRLSFEKHIMNEKENDEFRSEIERILKNYSENIHARITEGGWDGKDSADQPEQWSFPSSLLYAITVMTTIGYGHVAPKTDVGRIVTIAYAVLGIPLTLLCLTNIGDVMAHGFRMLYGKFFCGLCCVLFRPARRKRLDPEKGMAPGEERMMLQEEDKSKEIQNVPTSVCLLLMTAYIMIGTLLFARWEKWDAVTGTYFCFITLSTIGFGDVVPGISSKNWDNEKLILCAMYLVIGLSLIAMCFNLVQEDVKGKCKWLGMKLGIIDKPVAPQI